MQQELNQKEQRLFDSAKNLLEKGTNAVDFSRRFFSSGGKLQELCENQKEKEKLVKSELYKWLQNELAQLRKNEAIEFEEEVQKLSGRLTVVVPKSLHAALKREAMREGVSLSELIRLKLGYPYQLLTSLLSEDSNINPSIPTY